MTTATRKAKTPAPKLPLLQKGDRIRGTSPSGTQHEGTFEGYSSQDLILCKEEERTIALNPASVERVAAEQVIAQHFQSGDYVICLVQRKGCHPHAVFKIGMIDDEGAWLELVGDPEAQPIEPAQLSELRLATEQEVVDLAADVKPAPQLPTRITEVNSVAIYQGAAYYSEPKQGAWRLASDEELAALEKGDRVSEVELPWVYEFVKLGGDGTGDMVAVCAFVDHPCFRYSIPVARLQVSGFRSQESEVSDQESEPGEAEAEIIPSPASNPAAQLSVLAVEILALYADAEQAEATMLNAGKAALSLYIALGEKLLAVKNQIGHGEWLPWLKARKIQERKAQRAIAVFKGFPQLAAKNDSVTDLTLTEALSQLSKKALKPAQPDQESAASGEWQAKIPDAIEQRYQLTGDHATPALQELMVLYAQIGTVRRWKQGFAVERDDIGNPFPLAFQNRASAWRQWQAEWRAFAATHPLPATEAPLDALPAITKKTEGLEGEKRAYEYEPIDPKPVWFDPGGGVVEGQAIATNERGMVRIAWGESRESDVPRDRLSWSDPAATAVTADEIDAALSAINDPAVFRQQVYGDEPAVQANGIAAERPACSRWLPEEVENVTRISLQGLLKHLSPGELVKAAIVHSGVSLPDAVRVAVEMASESVYTEILAVIKANSFPEF